LRGGTLTFVGAGVYYRPGVALGFRPGKKSPAKEGRSI
jgi:hypothetical protein